MKQTRRFLLQRFFVGVSIFILFGVIAVAQPKQRSDAARQEIQIGRGMTMITADLLEIGAQTKLFLRFTDQINLTVEQKKKLEELYYQFQKSGVQQEADLDVADAQLRRLLTGDSVDLTAVRAKVKELEAIRAAATMKRIEILLQALNTLTHEQHLRVMLAVQDLTKPQEPTQFSMRSQ